MNEKKNYEKSWRLLIIILFHSSLIERRQNPKLGLPVFFLL